MYMELCDNFLSTILASSANTLTGSQGTFGSFITIAMTIQLVLEPIVFPLFFNVENNTLNLVAIYNLLYHSYQ